MANERKTCAHCKTTAEARGLPSLQACARCKTALYCGRDCQKADYKSHKKFCPKPVEHSNSYSAPHLHDLERHLPDPFTRLDEGTYVHG
jgi:splicing suppressor protein 51